MKQMNRILVIVQRSNGDVFLSSPLIASLYSHYAEPQIDLLVNDDTLGIARTLAHIDQIHSYSYGWRKLPLYQRIKNEYSLLKSIYKKYDLSINLTASDRSVMYAVLAGRYSISAVEKDEKKSWWKNVFLNKSYVFDMTIPIVKNNTASLALLGIKNDKIEVESHYSADAEQSVLKKLKERHIDKFVIFHPSAQYDYKIYPKQLRDKLLVRLDSLGIPIVITGARSTIDLRIKGELPSLTNVYDFIAETTLDEYIALSALCEAYIGMDTLNMHIAAAQNKRVFTIFGPSILNAWSPWCNALQKNTHSNKPKQTYGNITIFQADMACVACGLAGCDDKHGKSDCLEKIDPEMIFEEVKCWLIKSA